MPSTLFEMLDAIQQTSLTLAEQKTALALAVLLYGQSAGRGAPRRYSLSEIGRKAGLNRSRVHDAINGRPATATQPQRPGLVAKAVLLPPAGKTRAAWQFNESILDWPLNDAYRISQGRFFALRDCIDPVKHLIKADPAMVYDCLRPIAGKEDIWLMAIILDAGNREKPERWLLKCLMGGKWSPSDPATTKAKELLGYTTSDRIRRFADA